MKGFAPHFLGGFLHLQKVENIDEDSRIYLPNLWVSSVSSFAQDTVTKKPQKSIPFFPGFLVFSLHSLKLTARPCKMDGWNTIVSFWVPKGIFSGAFAVSFRECHPGGGDDCILCGGLDLILFFFQ